MESSNDCCSGCHLVLHDPYVQCHVCLNNSLKLCLECFAKGREVLGHESSHDYTIIQSDFSLLDPDWTAQEEMQLLNALLQRGHGNWEDIAKVLVNKTPQQCEEHFERNYVENRHGMFHTPWHESQDRFRQDQPVAFVSPMEHPIRPAHGSQMQKEIAGYNVARGDFDQEHENTAEVKIKDVDFDTMVEAVNDLDSGGSLSTITPLQLDESSHMDERLVSHLQLAAVQVFNNKLKSRIRRKRIVRELGLLNKGRAASLPSVYHKIVKAGTNYDRLFKLGRLMCAFDFDYFLESFQHEIVLRQRILQLQECRTNGMEWLHSAEFFYKMKAQREQQLRDLRQEGGIGDWLPRLTKSTAGRDAPLAAKVIPSPLVSTRRSAAPLEVIGLPGFEKLDESERELCSEIRVYPEVFLDIRETMIAECEKLDGLRLADARPVIKIDVNKTRKIYDFFLKKKIIRKPK